MNHLLLSRRLGTTGPQTFQRLQYERLLQNVAPEPSIHFNAKVTSNSNRDPLSEASPRAGSSIRTGWTAHDGGVNVLAIDDQTGRYLISGGADASIRLWDLEHNHSNKSSYIYHPIAASTRSTSGSHSHALTSLSIYPFDPVPSTILTTAYDKTLKLFSLEAARVHPVHTFDLGQTPYSHNLSSVPSSSALIAVGTASPDVRLLDLRSGLATHNLPGHTGAVLSVRWSPRSDHLLASGSTDGRVLFFDVRRAHSAFACLDLDDAIGVFRPDDPSNNLANPRFKPRPALSWNSLAHNGPVTGVRWIEDGRKLITCGHDQRLRIWDAATGRNDLVHFGPRIKNLRNAEFAPLPAPSICNPRPGRGTTSLVFWANDDGRGDIFVMDVTEGTTLRILKTAGMITTPPANPSSSSRSSSSKRGRNRLPPPISSSTSPFQRGSNPARLTSAGRINAMAWRPPCGSGTGILQLYSAHGDGSLRCWRGVPPGEEEAEEEGEEEEGKRGAGGDGRDRKRKRDVLDSIVAGLAGTPIGTTTY
jgi:DNA excision repair protein ERCC-8